MRRSLAQVLCVSGHGLLLANHKRTRHLLTLVRKVALSLWKTLLPLACFGWTRRSCPGCVRMPRKPRLRLAIILDFYNFLAA